ncbi:hypothetical protein Bbelb_418190 [Branchiostoma belcheri]|nr:hypothetical protein Bbelb_418190 [Branchiostoma belcheri]
MGILLKTVAADGFSKYPSRVDKTNMKITARVKPSCPGGFSARLRAAVGPGGDANLSAVILTDRSSRNGWMNHDAKGTHHRNSTIDQASPRPLSVGRLSADFTCAISGLLENPSCPYVYDRENGQIQAMLEQFRPFWQSFKTHGCSAHPKQSRKTVWAGRIPACRFCGIAGVSARQSVKPRCRQDRVQDVTRKGDRACGTDYTFYF